MNLNSPGQQVAEQAANAIGNIITQAAQHYVNPPARLTFLMSVTLPGIMGIISGVCKGGTEQDFRPDNDHLLFACLLIAATTSRVTGVRGDNVGFMVEYSIDNIVKSLEMFTELTSRSFEPRMNDSLLEVVNRCRTEAKEAFAGDMSKFSPQ